MVASGGIWPGPLGPVAALERVTLRFPDAVGCRKGPREGLPALALGVFPVGGGMLKGGGPELVDSVKRRGFRRSDDPFSPGMVNGHVGDRRAHVVDRPGVAAAYSRCRQRPAFCSGVSHERPFEKGTQFSLLRDKMCFLPGRRMFTDSGKPSGGPQ